ncbi:MAG TPA: tRNA uracil 4-sulfurtransferase ThiI [Candidatus Onthovivens sp.]|nr:tRNA uracil 4-sulfurtransferase ThiI [Candidatus Onthovivens sp.]
MEFNCIIVRFGELTTKGKNKVDFINKLSSKIRNEFAKNSLEATIINRYDHIYIYPSKKSDYKIVEILEKIPGMYSFSLALKVEDAEIENILNISLEEVKKEEGKTFKVYTRRIDKSYPYISDDINRQVAKKILSNTQLKVDVHHPDILLSIEIRDDGAYFFTKTIKAMGGLPVGSTGRALMMLSGGIDSPVAAYLLMKRGVEVSCIHFASPPYTNIGVINKLEDLLSELNIYQNKIKLYIIRFTKIQEKIYEISPEGYPITIMRRMMYRLSSMLADKLHISALANGESIGQVASQTLESLATINEVTNKVILRPLAVTDKLEIIKISKEINTYDISIRPFTDCCTIFAPKNPKTKPRLDECEKIEAKFDFTPLLEEAIINLERKIIK